MDRFWDVGYITRKGEDISRQLEDSELVLDSSNVLRLAGEPVAIVSPDDQTPLNSLRELTSSFGYTYGSLDSPLEREDGILVSGYVNEFIPGIGLEEWLEDPSRREEEIYSALAQLCYASSLLSKRRLYLPQVEIRMRQVPNPDATVPFYKGSIVTHGWIPVVLIRGEVEEGEEQEIVSDFLSEVYTISPLAPVFNSFEKNYLSMNLSEGKMWGDLYSSGVADYTCKGRFCPGPYSSNGGCGCGSSTTPYNSNGGCGCGSSTTPYNSNGGCGCGSSNISPYSSNGQDELELEILDTVYLPLPRYLQDYAEEVGTFLVPDLEETQEYLTDLRSEYRRFHWVDILEPSYINEFYIRDKSGELVAVPRSDLHVIDGILMRTIGGSRTIEEISPNDVFILNIDDPLEYRDNAIRLLELVTELLEGA